MIGRVVKAHGIKGEVKVYPYTDEPTTLLRFTEVTLQDQTGNHHTRRILRGRMQGRLAILQVAAVQTRDQAEALAGWEVWVEKGHLPPLAEDEFYLHDLEGRRVVTTDGREVGVVSGLLTTAAHDVLVVTNGDREHLIPAIPEFIAEVEDGDGPVVISPVPGLLEIND